MRRNKQANERSTQRLVTMKRVFFSLLAACALAGNVKAGVVEVNGFFISDQDAEKLGLKASVQTKAPTPTPEQSAYSKWQGTVVAGGRDEDMAFDLNRRPTEIGEVLKNAGYSCTSSEIDTLRGFIRDYSWDFVIKIFRDSEVALRRFRMLGEGTPAEIDQHARILFRGVAETATNSVEPFINKLVLKKHGLAS
jgi:hypothetical protein